MTQLTRGTDTDRAAAIDRYLTLLKSGGNDHPMTLLQKAGVDLSRPETVRAVVDQLDSLVSRLEKEIAAL
jgi:oligoendopeptidase F